MTHHIAVDDATYATLKETAKFDGRTMSGLVGFLIRDYAKKMSLPLGALGNTPTTNKPLSEKERVKLRIKDLNAALAELDEDEDADAYETILEKIGDLQSQIL